MELDIQSIDYWCNICGTAIIPDYNGDVICPECGSDDCSGDAGSN